MKRLRIGLTGNIGAGKSTVAREFERLGVPVYSADRRAKALMEEDARLIAAIKNRFGEQAYTPAGALNRTYLAERVFGDPPSLAALNALVHPVVARDAAEWHERQITPYTLQEAAITYEIGTADAYDAVVVVTAPVEVRARRVTQRDGSSRSQFDERAAQQWPEERKAAAADYLIANDGYRLLLPQVLAVDRCIRRGGAHFSEG